MSNELTPQQRLFVWELLADEKMNATQAAIRAGYSAKTAKQQGSRLTMDPRVAELIEQAKREREKKAKVDAEYLLAEITRIQKANICDIVDDHGNVKDVSQWPKIWQRMVQSIEVEELWSKGKDPEYLGRVKRVKMMDRTKILELLGKHVDVSAFAEKHLHEHTGRVEHTHTERLARLGSLKEQVSSGATAQTKH